MAKQIKRTDIAEEDLFKNIRESAEDTIKVLEKMKSESGEMARGIKDAMSGMKFDNSKGLKEFLKNVEKLNQVLKARVKIEDELRKAQDVSTKASIEEEKILRAKIQTRMAERREAEQVRKLEEAEMARKEKMLKQTQSEQSAYKQLSTRLAEYKRESKDLAATLHRLEQEGQKGTKQWYETSKAYKEATKQAAKLDQELKDIDKRVGDNQRNVGNYAGAVDKLRNGLGALGLAFGFQQVIQGGIEKIVEFDQAVADLSAITGASGKDLTFMKEQAIEMGVAVEGGAAGVVEAYKLIASAKPELLKNAQALNQITKEAITLSQASGLDLPEAATNLTAALNQFGAPASEASRYINVLAAGSKEGSKEIPEVTQALLKFGGVAKSMNVSVEESVGLIEILGPSFKSAEEAGTGLRNVLLKMAAPEALSKDAVERMQELGVNFDVVSDKSLPVVERLRAMAPLLEDDAALIKVFGEGNIIAAKAALSQTDALEELLPKLTDTNVAYEQAEKRSNTLGFAINQLKESWNNLWLEMMSGEGASNFLIKALKFLADNLKTILSYIGKAVKAWLVYKATIAVINAKNWLLNGGLKATIQGLGNMAKSLVSVKSGGEQAAKGLKAAGNGMKSIPFVAIIAGLIEIATAFYDIATGADIAAQKAERLKEIQEGQGKSGFDAAGATKEIDEWLQRMDTQIDKELALGKITEENAAKQKEFYRNSQKYINMIKKGTSTGLGKDFENWVKNMEQGNYWLNEYINMQDQVEGETLLGMRVEDKIASAIDKYEAEIVKAEGTIRSLRAAGEFKNRLKIANEQAAIEANRANIEGLKEYQKQIKTTAATMDVETTAITRDIRATTNYNKGKKEVADTLSFNLDLYKEMNKAIDEQYELLKKVEDLKTQREVDTITQQIDVEMMSQGNAAELTGFYNVDALETLYAERLALKEKLLDAEANAEKDALFRQHTHKFEFMRQDLEEEFKEKMEAAKGNQKVQDKLQASYKENMDKIRALELEEEKNQALQYQAIDENLMNEKLKLRKETDDQVFDMNEELIGKAEKYAEDQKKISEDLLKSEGETAKEWRKELYESMIETIDVITDYFKKKSEERIAQWDKEIQEAQSAYDLYAELAKQGNIDAKESLAEQQEIIAEANRKKMQEERRIQAMEKASAFLKTYLKNVEDPDVKNPLNKTISDIALMGTYLATIPTFMEGTEDTGTNGLGVDGKGGFNAILHPNERVMTKEQNRLVGDLSNDALAQLAYKYQTGQMVNMGDGATQIGGEWAFGLELINEVKNLNKTIKNKPETNIEVERIIDGAMTIVRSTRESNTITNNRYRIKK